MLAARRDHAALVTLLLEQGKTIDVNARRDDGQTALHIATEDDSVEVVRVLLANHADVEAKDASGETPLTLAEANHHSEIVKLLRPPTH